MTKSKAVIKNISHALIFLIMLHFLLRYLGLALYPDIFGAPGENGEIITEDFGTYYFAQTERNTVDEVFVGNSHLFCSIDPNILNKEYGMNSILLTSAGQTLTYSYYAVKEALELQNPEKIILEVRDVIPGTAENVEVSKTYFLDNMPNYTRTKFECIKEIGWDNLVHYYPILYLHGGFKELKLKDFILPPRLAEGERFSYIYTVTTPFSDFKAISADEKLPLSEYAEYELTRITQLCRKNNIELILFTAPYQASKEDQRYFNAVADFAAENGLRYVNLFHEFYDAGMDPETDFHDYGHLNRSGQLKVTRYMAEQGYFS